MLHEPQHSFIDVAHSTASKDLSTTRFARSHLALSAPESQGKPFGYDLLRTGLRPFGFADAYCKEA
eukprot:12275072-Karenia_brevis.AAC.1